VIERIILEWVIKMELNVQNCFRIRLSWLTVIYFAPYDIVGMIIKQETGDHVQKGFGSDEVT